MGSDAYATGEALYALNVAGGMPATDPGYAKGVKYLLNTQAADALAPNSRAIVHCLGWQGEGVCPPAQPFGVVNAGRQGRSDLLEQRLWMGTAFLPGPITRVLAR